jgi:hypothetical protein
MTDNDVVDVSERDVLLGRGKRSNNWPGNIRFRKLVDAEQNAYMTASDDITRDAIAFEIANAIERQGGRFLRETVVEVNGVPRSAWMVVEGAAIRTKVKQALRDSSKAKSREENAIQGEGHASGEDRKQPATRTVGGTPADSKMAGGKRPRAAAQQQQDRQDAKRPAAVLVGPPAEQANMMSLIGTSEANQRQQHIAHASQNPAWFWPLSQDPLPPPYGYTPDQQLRAALLEREQQQLSLLRTLAAEQQQQLRLEEERRALAAALQMGLPAAAGLFPSHHLDSFSFRNFPIAPLSQQQQQQQPTAFVVDHLRVPTNQPSPTDTLAALQRLRQTQDARQNLLGRQTMIDHQLQQALQLLRNQQLQQQQQLQYMAAVPPLGSHAAIARPEEATMLQPPGGALLGEPIHPPNRLLLQHPATARNADDSRQSSSEEDSEGSRSSSDGKEQGTSKQVGKEPGDDPADLA